MSLHNIDRLAALNWLTLEKRRIYADLILCFKIVHGLICVEPNSIFTCNSSSMGTRGHKFKLAVQRTSSNVRHNFFSIRVVPMWNELPASVVECGSVDAFKKLVRFCDVSKYCKARLD